MSIIISQPWGRKPPSHLARLLENVGSQSIAYLLDGSVSPTGKAFQSLIPLSGNIPGPANLYCDGSTWLQMATLDHWLSTAPQNDGEFTLLIAFSPTLMHTDVARLAIGNAAASADSGWFAGYENRVAASSPDAFRVVVFNGSTVRVDARVSVAQIPDGSEIIGAFSCSSAGVYIAANGQGVSYSWSNSATSGNATRSTQIGKTNYTSTILPMVGSINLAVLLNKRLPNEYVRRLTTSPWQLFAPQTRRIVLAPAAAAVPTLSSSTYVTGSLTSTGWRPQITAS